MKRIAIVLILLICSPAFAIEYGAPSLVSQVASHVASTTGVHGLSSGVAPVGASGAQTLYDKTLDGNTTVFNGSTTQNFSVATLTFGNMSSDVDIYYSQTASQAIGSGDWLLFPFNNKVRDDSNAFSGGTFTAPSFGLYLVSVTITGQANKAGAGNQIGIYLQPSTPSSVDGGKIVYGSPVVGATDFPMCSITHIVRLSAGQKLLVKTTMISIANVSCYADGYNNKISIVKLY